MRHDTMKRHGEFKVPGGKLVVADFVLREGSLREVTISGDFFLEPPEALAAINVALEGLPADAPASLYAEAVAQALPADAELFGFSPDAVATTLKRALA